MRTDEAGRPCPSTLGEYRDLCATHFALGEDSEAVAYLDREIAKRGREYVVPVPDYAVRELLIPRLAVKAGTWPVRTCGCCGNEIVAVQSPRMVQSGDLFFCNNCGAVSRFGADLILEPVDVATLDTLTKAMVEREQARRRAGRAN